MTTRYMPADHFIRQEATVSITGTFEFLLSDEEAREFNRLQKAHGEVSSEFFARVLQKAADQFAGDLVQYFMMEKCTVEAQRPICRSHIDLEPGAVCGDCGERVY